MTNCSMCFDGKIIDDSENIDEIVDNFIEFCHADYLKGD